MTQAQYGNHIVRAYDRELGRLRALVLDMKTRVIEQTRVALAALLQPDLNAAHQVIGREPGIDTLTLEADEEIFILIAKRQPTAIDLRLVLAISRVVNDLERGGDYAVRMAHSAIRLHEHGIPSLPEPFAQALEQLSAEVCRRLEQAVRALSAAELDQAIAVFETELQFQQCTLTVREQIFASPQASQPQTLAELLSIHYALERLGQHGANIAEQAVYVIRGDDVRYRNRELLIDALRQAESTK